MPNKSFKVRTVPVGKTIANYSSIFDLRKVSVVQQYSMRSYQTGLYDILTDGNVNSMSRILYDLVLNMKDLKTPIEEITFSVPHRSTVKGGIESIEKLKNRLEIVTHTKIEMEELEYGAHARENRDELDGLCLLDGHINISYFRHARDLHSGAYIFICPGSPRKENPLYSMDEFDYFLDSIRNSDMTFFYNGNQNIYGELPKCFEAASVTFEMSRERQIEEPLPHFDFYFPYRLSDKDYMFEDFLLDLPSGTVVAVTDPNESLGSLKPLETVQSTVNYGVTLLKMDPSKHLDVVRSIVIENEAARRRNLSKGFTCPKKIVMTSKLNHTLHMGPVEMYSIAFPKGYSGEKLDHFKYIRGGTNEFFFEEESKRALGRI